jgi:PEP-CTERM motif
MAIMKGVPTVAFAAVIAGLSCEPAQAGTSLLAFENTQSNTTEFYASLELFNGSTLLTTVSTKGFQGWVSNLTTLPLSIGGPNGANTSYTVGSTGNMLLADYFGFKLGGVSATLKVNSAKLVVYSGTINANLTLNLVGATQYANQLLTPPIQSSTLYNELVNRANTSYGQFSLADPPNPLTQLMFTLNDAAVSEIKTQIQRKGLFVVSGNVDGVPEPSTWVMMLAGFAGLGVLARRRAARRRAVAAAG